MNTLWKCDECCKQYKTLSGFKKHKCKNKREDLIKLIKLQLETPIETPLETPIETPIIKKKRKKKISSQVRFDVWNTYIGNNIKAKCFCCWKNTITPFTYYNTFQAGHIHSEANGGEISIGNLLPICRDCNCNMHTLNWDEYIKYHTNFCVRIYGDNIPISTINKIIKIQRCYKQYIKQKTKIKKRKKIRKRRKIKKIFNYLKHTKSSLNKIKIFIPTQML